MNHFPILSVMLAVPLLAGLACLLVEAKLARAIALAATLVDFALGLVLWARFDLGGAQWQFQESQPLFSEIGRAHV